MELLSDALDPGVYTASNIYEYQKQVKKYFWGVGARPVREADNLIAICEPCLDNAGFLTSHNTIGLHCLLLG
jgi:hypothetical protein